MLPHCVSLSLSHVPRAGLALSRVYKANVAPMCFKSELGRRIYSVVPIGGALLLQFFYLEAGLYLIMDGESGAWHVLVGLTTLIGGGYYAWWIYAWSLPDEPTVIRLEEDAERRMAIKAAAAQESRRRGRAEGGDGGAGGSGSGGGADAGSSLGEALNPTAAEEGDYM